MNKKNLEPLIYERAWQKLREFPAIIHRGAPQPPTASGGAAAFLISGGIGAVTMMVVHHLSDTSKSTESWVKSIGS
jgi:hypothetical protein